jgi:hypothetical protein
MAATSPVPSAMTSGTKKVGALGDGRGEGARDGANQAFQIGVTDAGFSPGGVVNAVGRFGDGGGSGDFIRRPGSRRSGRLGGGFRVGGTTCTGIDTTPYTKPLGRF